MGAPPFAEQLKETRPKLEVVKRSDDTKGFKVLPRASIVERTFAWLMRHRRQGSRISPICKVCENYILV